MRGLGARNRRPAAAAAVGGIGVARVLRALPDRGRPRRRRRLADAIVPSPLMPHLMADWLVERARARWPERGGRHRLRIDTLPVDPVAAAGDDGTHYVSFAEWICPINCIEPARCPQTRGPRSWSLPVALASHVRSWRGRANGACRSSSLHAPRVRRRHDRRARRRGRRRDDRRARRAAEATFLVGTVSHCHGALRCISIGAPSRERPGSIADFYR